MDKDVSKTYETLHDECYLKQRNKLSNVSYGILFYCLTKFNQKILILSRFCYKKLFFLCNHDNWIVYQILLQYKVVLFVKIWRQHVCYFLRNCLCLNIVLYYGFSLLPIFSLVLQPWMSAYIRKTDGVYISVPKDD